MTEESKYTSLLRRHRKLVWRLCLRYARYDSDRCADMVQEVSIALWERFGRLRANASTLEEKAWVYWNTRYILGRMQHQRRFDTVPINEWMEDTLADERDGGNDCLEDLLSRLTEEDRTLVKQWLDGYKAEEIGEMTGMTRNNVYQRMFRIIQKLKKINP